MSRQTIIKSKKKLRKVHLLEFTHCSGLATAYSFPEFSEVTKFFAKKSVEVEVKKDTPTQDEFVAYLKLSPYYKENLLPDILERYNELERKGWVTQNGKISDWKKEAKRIISNIMWENFRKNY